MLIVTPIETLDDRSPADRVRGIGGERVVRRLLVELAPRDAIEQGGETIDWVGGRALASLPGLAELLAWLGHERRPGLDDARDWAWAQGGAVAYARPAAWPESAGAAIAPGLAVESCDAGRCVVRATGMAG